MIASVANHLNGARCGRTVRFSRHDAVMSRVFNRSQCVCVFVCATNNTTTPLLARITFKVVALQRKRSSETHFSCHMRAVRVCSAHRRLNCIYVYNTVLCTIYVPVQYIHIVYTQRTSCIAPSCWYKRQFSNSSSVSMQWTHKHTSTQLQLQVYRSTCDVCVCVLGARIDGG